MSLPVAIDLTDASTFPTRRVEDWKWSDLRRWLREAPPPSPAIEVASNAGEIVIANGRGPDSFTAEGDGELRLRFVSRAEHTGHQARFALTVRAGATLRLRETYEGQGAGYAAKAALTIVLEPGARLSRIVVLDDPADAISISVAEVALGAGAAFDQTVLTSGAKLQRFETRVAHPGAGASVRLDGLYVLEGERHADLTTVVEHKVRGGETRQLTKGAVKDRSRGVFQGRIVVEHGADQTDARMGHHALILSDRAEVDAKPELEIYADDVSCAHGNTIGALDLSALFYAMARGIPEAQARAMLAEAFLGEVLDRIEDEPSRDAARDWLAGRLGAL